MRKIILALAIFTVGFTNAQETKFGVKGGLNIASLTNRRNDSVWDILNSFLKLFY